MLSENPPAPDACLRLACASFWSATGSPLGHLLALRERLLRAATARGVRVAVLHRAQWLFHWVEGPSGAVDAAWQRIQRMPELEANRLLHRSVGAPALREPVHIAAVFRRERADHVARHIAKLADRAPAVPHPEQLWHALAAPGPVRPCASVVVASAREHDGIDLLRRVAHDHGAEIVYRRFADADLTQFDTGAAFMDTGPGRCVLRMHVLSRRCLRNGLVLGGLGRVRELVLLLGTRDSASRQLAEAAQELLRSCADRVRVHLFASDVGSLAAVESMLRASEAAAIVSHVVRPGAHEAELLQRLLAELALRHGDRCPSVRDRQDALAA